MSIVGHWRNATGFDTTDYTVTLGKPVADCSVEELSAHPMCGSISPFANVAYTATSEEILNGNIRYIGGAAGFTYPITSEHSETWAIAGAPSDDIRKQYRRTIFVACPSTVSMPAYFLSTDTDSRILIVEDMVAPNKLVINYGATSDYGDDIYRTVNFKISDVACKHTCNRGQTAYATAPNQVEYTPEGGGTTVYYNIYPVWLYIYEGEAYVVLWEYLCFFGGRYKASDTSDKNFNYIQQGNFQSFSQITPKWLAMGYNPNTSGDTTTLHDIFPNGYADPVPTPAQFINVPQIYPTTNLGPDGAGVVYGLQMSNNTAQNTYVCTLQISLYTGNQWYRANTMCRAGCYFVNNGELLKPIIEGGIVIGYGTPEEESEIDSYTDLKHPVPSGPGGGPTPPPGPSGDEWDNMPISGSTIGALAGVSAYVCSKTDITSLKSWMSKMQADGGPPDGYDVMQNIISVMAFPIDMTRASAGPARPITFNGLSTGIDNSLLNIMTALVSISNAVGATPEAQVKTFTSPVSALPCAGNPFDISLGTITCPVFYPDSYPFADYDASVEVYIPFVGCLPLDTQSVSGRELKATLSIDPVTGAVYGQCECYKSDDGAWVTVAAGSGAMGVTTPISANQVGLAMAQVKNAAGATRDAAITSALTIGAGAIANTPSMAVRHITRPGTSPAVRNNGMRGIVAGMTTGATQATVSAIPSAVGTSLANNRAIRQISQSNHNSIAGSSGGTTADWSCHYGAYLKITAPNIHDAGENYKHTYGVPAIASGALSSFTGFTICVNPDVSGISIATDNEKTNIYNYLTGGVYV